jgi:hypothetical protein
MTTPQVPHALQDAVRNFDEGLWAVVLVGMAFEKQRSPDRLNVAFACFRS